MIAMNAEELTSFLGEQHTCRFATTGPDGPHVAPVWFVWDGQAIWVYSLIRSQRWANVSRDPRVAVVVDDGHHYHELHGVEIEGQATVSARATHRQKMRTLQNSPSPNASWRPSTSAAAR